MSSRRHTKVSYSFNGRVYQILPPWVYFFESFYIPYAVFCPAVSQKLHIDVGLSTVPFVRHIYSLLERHQCVNVHRSLTNVLNKGFTLNPEWLKCFNMLLSLWYVKFCPSFCETTDTWCKITVLAQDLFSWLINFTWIHFSHFTQSVPLLEK